MNTAQIAKDLVGVWTTRLLGAWFLMLFMGAVHADAIAAVPPVSYWGAVLLALLAETAGGLFRGFDPERNDRLTARYAKPSPAAPVVDVRLTGSTREFDRALRSAIRNTR